MSVKLKTGTMKIKQKDGEFKDANILVGNGESSPKRSMYYLNRTYNLITKTQNEPTDYSDVVKLSELIERYLKGEIIVLFDFNVDDYLLYAT